MSKRAIDDDHPGHPAKRCAAECKIVRPKEEYSMKQWKKAEGRAFCKKCVEKRAQTKFVHKQCAAGALGTEGKTLGAEGGGTLGAKAGILGAEGGVLGAERGVEGAKGGALGAKAGALGVKAEALGAEGGALGTEGGAKTAGEPKKEHKKCAGDCKLIRPREAYSVTQWEKRMGEAFCKDCVQKERCRIGHALLYKKCAGECKLVRAKVYHCLTE